MKTPKLYVRDSGLLCHMMGITEPRQLNAHPAAGSLWETWAHDELRKLIAHGPQTRIGFFRTHTGHEVDFVIQRGDELAAIEVKREQTVTAEDFRGIHALREIAGPKTRGIVLYGGSEVVPFGEGLAAVPFGVLVGREQPAKASRKKTS